MLVFDYQNGYRLVDNHVMKMDHTVDHEDQELIILQKHRSSPGVSIYLFPSFLFDDNSFHFPSDVVIVR